MDIHCPSQGYLHSPTICHGLVAQDLATRKKPKTVKLYHYNDHIVLISDSLADLEGEVPRLLQEGCEQHQGSVTWFGSNVLGGCLVK